MIPEDTSKILKEKEFIHVATADPEGKPYAAPKFLLKVEDGRIYLIDYIFGRTWENLKARPRVSLSTLDMDSLIGYQINGSVQLIDRGEEFDRIIKEVQKKVINFTTERIIEGLHREKEYAGFEITFPESFVVYKVDVEEVTEIGPSGTIKREK